MRGGTGGLKFFLQDYKKNLSNYYHAPLQNPVVVLIDNDAGANQIFSLLKDMFKIEIDLKSTDSFYKLYKNLYLIKTPEGAQSGTSKIEDLFSTELLSTKLNGKSFNAADKIDIEKDFGKVIFAEKVVLPNRRTIDFSKFSPLLDRISAAVSDYKAVWV